MAMQSMTEWFEKVREESKHIRQVRVSWSDDGVTLMCEREECMEQVGTLGDVARRLGVPRYVYWQREYDGIPYPEDLVKMRDRHIAGEI